MGHKTVAAGRHADMTAALMAEVHQGIDYEAGYIHLDCSGPGDLPPKN